MLNISDLKKSTLLVGLYDFALERKGPISQRQTPVTWSSNLKIGEINLGRGLVRLDVDLTGKTFCPQKYNDLYGKGAAQHVLQTLRKVSIN